MKRLFSLLILSGFVLTGCVMNQKKALTVILPTPSPLITVPLPSKEDAVNLFFSLINEKKIPEAIAMMDKNMVSDDNAKQGYGVQFNAIQSIKVTEIQPALEPAGPNTFQVRLEVAMDPASEKAMMPFYGWDPISIRWVELTNNNGQWQIASLSTGP